MKHIIKKILKEETNLKTKIHKFIKNVGIIDTMKIAGGKDRFMKKMDINTPMDYLHLFDDLEVVQSEEKKDWTLFRYKPKHNLMIYNRKTEHVYINYDEIWSVLQFDFDINYTEIQRLTKEWLSEVYNLRGVTTRDYWRAHYSKLSEVYNLNRI
jgi:hypothetical protein